MCVLIEEKRFGDDADGVVSDDHGAGDEIARTFGADRDAVGTDGIQVRFDPLTGGASGFWAAKKEAEQAEIFSELLMEKE